MLRCKVLHLPEGSSDSCKQVAIYAIRDENANDLIVISAWHESIDKEIYYQYEEVVLPVSLIDSYIRDFSEESAMLFVDNFHF